MVKACNVFTPSPMSVLVDRLLGSLLGIGAPKNYHVQFQVHASNMHRANVPAVHAEPLVSPKRHRGTNHAESRDSGGPVSRPDVPVRTEAAHGEGLHVIHTEPLVSPDRQRGTTSAESSGSGSPVSRPDMLVRTEATHGEGLRVHTEPLVSPNRHRGTNHAESRDSGGPVSRPDMLVRTEAMHGEGLHVVQTEPCIRPSRQQGIPEDPSPYTHAKSYTARVLAPMEHVISQAVNRGYEACTTLASGILPRAWMPTLRHLMQRDPPINSPEPPATRTWVARSSRDEPKLAMQRMRPCLVENLPRRVSRQRIVPSPLADPMLYNMQAGGNTCPAEPLGETIRLIMFPGG